MNEYSKPINDCDDSLEAHQLPIEDIVTAVDGQDPQAFLDTMATILDDSKAKGEA